jgi:hypothetical protein
MTKFNKPAMGFVLVGTLILGGCAGERTTVSSDTTRNNTTLTQPGQDQTANNAAPGTQADNTTTTDQNNTTANNTGDNQTKATGDLSLVSFDKSAKPGQEVTLTAKAEPGTKLKIETDGTGFDPGLGDQTANESGEVTWKFKVNDNFKADKMPIIVTALYDQLEKKQIAEINIQQPKDKMANFKTDVSGLKTSVKPGEQISMKIKTAPNADVKIDADGIDGMDPGSKKANDQGIAEFSFKVDDDYKADKMPIIVTTELNGKEKKMIETVETNKVAMKTNGDKNL